MAADEKRAKTRLEIIQDELKYRMVTDEVSEMKFAGLLSVTYQPETVFSVGEDGWIPVYSNIVADSVANQLVDGDVAKDIADDLDLSEVAKVVITRSNDVIDNLKNKIDTDRIVHGEDTSRINELLDYVGDEFSNYEVEIEQHITRKVVDQVVNKLIENLRDGLLNPEAFAILQKRLTNPTLNALLKQGYDLPKGIEQTTIRKVKTKRLK